MTFLRQDYTTFRKLKRVWRRPKGKQSKMRKDPKGKPPRAKVGYKKPRSIGVPVVSNLSDLKSVAAKEVIMASGLGAKKAEVMSKEAEKLGIKIANKRKVIRAGRISGMIIKKREEAKKAKEKKDEKPGDKGDAGKKAEEETKKKTKGEQKEASKG